MTFWPLFGGFGLLLYVLSRSLGTVFGLRPQVREPLDVQARAPAVFHGEASDDEDEDEPPKAKAKANVVRGRD